ncbi:11558_t:CDS:2 [Entrophospora sp. SA101]|nr:11558_t:CDS:2 [Entrophospora sp. SA101]CAJ0866480.1 3620_t:CDS:2 [Entrophospora sp. SA101]
MSFLNKLSINFGSLLNEAYDYNVLISVGSKPNTKEFKAHSSVLRVRSLYFEHEFSNKWINQKNNIIELPKIDPASCDGFENNTFNEKCINQGSCFVVTKCNKTNRIVGGYTSVGFNYSYGYYNDPRSFLFSFDFNEIKNPIICCIQNYGHALYNNYYSGGYNNSIFNFGCGDLMMNNNCISCNGGSNNYKQLNLLNNNSNKFYASEIEAFKVQLNG